MTISWISIQKSLRPRSLKNQIVIKSQSSQQTCISSHPFYSRNLWTTEGCWKTSLNGGGCLKIQNWVKLLDRRWLGAWQPIQNFPLESNFFLGLQNKAQKLGIGLASFTVICTLILSVSMYVCSVQGDVWGDEQTSGCWCYDQLCFAAFSLWCDCWSHAVPTSKRAWWLLNGFSWSIKTHSVISFN